MKKRNLSQVITAILLAITLIVTGIYQPFAFDFSKTEAQAADSTLTEISWENFEGAEIGKTYSTAWTKFTYKDTTVTTLNNTKFVGQISFADGSGIRYGGSAESFGLHIYVSDGKLGLRSDTFTLSDDLATKKFEASQFGLTSGTFADTPFTLTITMTDVTTTSATVGVWVNDIAVDASFTITENGQWNASLGNKICIMDGNYSGSVTIPKPLPPTDLLEIGWRNFGIMSDTTYENHAYVTYAGGETLDGTLFSGDVTMGNTASSQASQIRYAASESGNWGLHICVENGLLYFTTATMNVVSGGEYLASAGKYYYASDFGVGESFSNATFNLKISTEIEGNNYTFGIWINDQMAGGYFTLEGYQFSSSSETYSGGNQIGLDINSAGFVVARPEEVMYKDITWRDFGAASGAYSTDWQYFTYQDTDVTTLNDTRFSGEIKFSEMTGIRFGGSDGSFGLHLSVESGMLVLSSDTFTFGDLTANKYSASAFGIETETFADEEITLTITMADVTPIYATVGIWVNGIAVDECFTMTSNDANTFKFGTKICIFDGNEKFTGTAVTIPKLLPPTNLKEIGWENFGITEDKTYADNAYVTYADSDTLDDTLFSGDIMIDTTNGPSEIRYAASQGGSWGLHIGVNTSGQLYLETHTMSGVSGTSYLTAYNATEFGLTTLSNTRFNLKISTEIDGGNYTFGVWVNDKMAGGYFTLGAKTVSSSSDALSGGNEIGLDINYAGTVTTYVSEAQPELTPIDWSDFGITYGSKYTSHKAVTYTGGSLNNTVFEDEVIMTAGAQFGYASSTGWDGIFIGLNAEGNLLICSDTCSPVFATSGTRVDTTPFEPALFGLTSFVNTKFTLKIETTGLTATSAQFRIWVNGVQVAGNTEDGIIIGTVTNTESYAFGNQIGLQRSGSGAIYMPADVAVPEGLEEITWEDFGIAANATYTGTVTGKAVQYTNLEDTLFDGDISMAAGSHIRYGGSTGDFGLHIQVTDAGELALRSHSFTFTGDASNFAPELFGLTTFADTKFNLKIAVSNVTETTATMCVWVNGMAVTESFTMTSQDANTFKTGNCFALYSGTFSVYTMFKQPTGLTTIAFKDFNNNQTNSSGESANGAAIENGTYGRNWIQAVYNVTGETLLNKSFRDTIRMVSSQAYEGTYYYTLQYGGSTSYGQNGGIRISLVGDNLVIHPAVNEFSGTWTLTPEVVGLKSFADTEFQLGIDAVEYKEHVLLWLYFDGVCYNNAPFCLTGFASQMTNTFMAVAGNGSTEWLADKLIIGATTKTLTSVHHSLSLSDYQLPAGLTKISGQTYKGASIDTSAYTGGQKITKAGIYTIQYNDGVSLYEQTVYLALTGDNNCNGELDSCDLVRLLKLVQVADYELEDGARAAADADDDGVISADDVPTLREAIVGVANTDKIMPIVGFREPTGNLLTDETYELIAGAGINTVISYENQFTSVALNRYQVYEQLTLAQNHNIKLTVSDAGLRANPSSVTADAVTSAAAKYDNFQSFAGLWTEDEPGSEYFSFAGRETLIDDFSNLALQARTAGYEIFSTLQAFHAEHGDDNSIYDYKAGSYNYVKYLNYYIEKFNPTMLTYDYYPFDKKNTGANVSGDVEGAYQYFQNLAMVRYVAQNANNGTGMPFWYTVQAGTNWNDDPTASLDPTDNNCPSEGEFKWNVNTALAFGAKGIQYFPMIQPSYFANTSDGTMDYQRNGLIGANGETTKWYDYAKDTNAQITAIDHVLMNATNEGLMSTGGYAKSQATDVVASIELYEKTEGFIDLFDTYKQNGTVTTTIYSDGYNGATVTSSDSEYGALTGCFVFTDEKNVERHALYIVNYNPSNTNTITVNLGSEKAVSYTVNAVTTETTASSISYALGAGEAMLIVY